MTFINPNRNTTLGFRSSKDFAARVDQLSIALGSCRSEVLRLSISEMLKNCQDDNYFQACKQQLY